MTNDPLNRRQFLTQTSAAATAGLAAAAIPNSLLAQQPAVKPDDAKPAEMAIIDCHQHLWDLAKFKLPWIKPGTLLGRSYVMKDYVAAIEGTGIRQAIYMEVDVDPVQQQAEVDHLTEICKSGTAPTVAAVVSGRPASETFGTYIGQFKENRYIKGIRQVLHGGQMPAGYCLRPEFVRGIRQLSELGLSFDLCLRPGELADGAKLADACPDTEFILDHCGNADVKAFCKAGDPRLKDVKIDHQADAWKRDIDVVAAKQNVICKISGIVARVPREWSAGDLAPVVNHCLDAFGKERVIFGSDWPVCLLGAPLAEWVAALRQIIAERPADEQKALLAENAVRFYGLDR
jgi:predicted TIM-barrel fold metal-dependent hydrolase